MWGERGAFVCVGANYDGYFDEITSCELNRGVFLNDIAIDNRKPDAVCSGIECTIQCIERDRAQAIECIDSISATCGVEHLVIVRLEVIRSIQ